MPHDYKILWWPGKIGRPSESAASCSECSAFCHLSEAWFHDDCAPEWPIASMMLSIVCLCVCAKNMGIRGNSREFATKISNRVVSQFKRQGLWQRLWQTLWHRIEAPRMAVPQCRSAPEFLNFAPNVTSGGRALRPSPFAQTYWPRPNTKYQFIRNVQSSECRALVVEQILFPRVAVSPETSNGNYQTSNYQQLAEHSNLEFPVFLVLELKAGSASAPSSLRPRDAVFLNHWTLHPVPCQALSHRKCSAPLVVEHPVFPKVAVPPQHAGDSWQRPWTLNVTSMCWHVQAHKFQAPGSRLQAGGSAPCPGIVRDGRWPQRDNTWTQ